MASMLEFTVSTRLGWETTITPQGELDLATVEQFEAACDSIDFASAGRVVLDLGELAFIDVSGLRSILRLHETCLRHSVVLVIRPGPRAVQRTFELTNTHSLLRFEPAASAGDHTDQCTTRPRGRAP